MPTNLEPMEMSTFRRVFKAFHYRDFRLMWIGACINEDAYEICVTKNNGEDKSGLASAGAFVNVRAFSQ